MARAKKEDIFYTLFKDLSAKLVEACDHYVEVMEGYPQTFSGIPELKVYESECDNKVQRIMRELYDSFITPFDRQDISDLALSMDDIMDYMNGAALCLDLFNVQEMRGEAVQMARLTRRCVGEVNQMINHLPNYKSEPEVMEHATMISDIEDEGDVVYNGGGRRLFHDEENGRTTVTWLRLFDRMESCIDACDHTAQVVRTVVMKSA